MRIRTGESSSSPREMLTDEKRVALEAAWAPARAAGVLGSASIEELWSHSEWYAEALLAALGGDCSTWNGRLIDVGCGAGVPGALLAAQLGRSAVTLVDASERRIGFAQRAAEALGARDRCQLVHGRGDDLARTPEHRAAYDVAVARLLADAADAVEQLTPLVRPGGVVVVSVAVAEAERWRSLDLAELGVISATRADGGMVVGDVLGLGLGTRTRARHKD